MEQKNNIDSQDIEVAEKIVTKEIVTDSESKSATKATSDNPSPKSNATRNVLIACGCLLLVCCGVLCGGFLLAPSALAGIVGSSTVTRDSSLTRIDESEISTVKETFQEKVFDNVFDNITSNQDTTTITLTEKELLVSLLGDNSGIPINANDLAIDIEPGKMRLEIVAKNLLESVGSSTEGQVNTSGLDNLYFTFNIVVSADGKSLEVEDFSTGNSFVDTLLSAELKQEVRDGFAQGFTQGLESTEISKIVLEKDQIAITYKNVL